MLGLRALLFKFTIWDHNASYGAALQNLRYTDARHKGPALLAPSKWQKASYGLVTVGGRYVWSRWEGWLAEQEGGYEEASYHQVIRAIFMLILNRLRLLSGYFQRFRPLPQPSILLLLSGHFLFSFSMAATEL